MGAYTHKPLRGQSCACGRPAWGNGPRCRTCVNKEKARRDLEGYGPDEMRRDTQLADRPRLRMEAERMAREGAAFYLNPVVQEEADHNMLTPLGAAASPNAS